MEIMKFLKEFVPTPCYFLHWGPNILLSNLLSLLSTAMLCCIIKEVLHVKKASVQHSLIRCAFGHNCAIFRLCIYKINGSSVQWIYDNRL